MNQTNATDSTVSAVIDSNARTVAVCLNNVTLPERTLIQSRTATVASALDAEASWALLGRRQLQVADAISVGGLHVKQATIQLHWLAMQQVRP